LDNWHRDTPAGKHHGHTTGKKAVPAIALERL